MLNLLLSHIQQQLLHNQHKSQCIFFTVKSLTTQFAPNNSNKDTRKHHKYILKKTKKENIINKLKSSIHNKQTLKSRQNFQLHLRENITSIINLLQDNDVLKQRNLHSGSLSGRLGHSMLHQQLTQSIR